MCRRVSIILLLCVAMFLPNIASAQFFARQQVVVWEVFDRNNDVKVAQGTKSQIRYHIIGALKESHNYDAYDKNVLFSDVEQKAMSKSPIAIARKVRELHPDVNFVLFTNVSILERSNSYDQYRVHLAVNLYSVETLKSERMAYVDMPSDLKYVDSACAKLVSDLLGEGQILNYSSNSNHQSVSAGYAQTPNRGESLPSPTPRSYVEDAGCGLGMKMIYVKGGTYRMGATSEQGGSADSDEHPVHSVTVKSFYMAECELTQAQWQKIMGSTIYQQRNKSNPNWSMYGVGDTYPMYYVNWEEANQFCQELSVITGRKYRLPTEAEWEYAARGGENGPATKYSGGGVIDNVAWYSGNSGDATHPVAQKRANTLGLYDMSGNVWEWCCDWYGGYSSSSQDNPMGPSSGQNRVLRGGSWSSIAGYCRVSIRNYDDPSSRYYYYGFRVVCLP